MIERYSPQQLEKAYNVVTYVGAAFTFVGMMYFFHIGAIIPAIVVFPAISFMLYCNTRGLYGPDGLVTAQMESTDDE